MATLLYFVSTSIDTPQTSERYIDFVQYTNLAGSTQWMSGLGPHALRNSRGSTATNTIETSVTGPTSGIEALYWFITPPLYQDTTISGTIQLNMRAYESSMSANATIGARIGYISATTGTFTEIGKGTYGTEVGTSEAGCNFNITPSSTTVPRGSRIAIIPYWDDATSTTMGNGYTLRFMYNGPTSGQSGDSWVQFTEAVLFESSAPSGTTIYPTTTSAGINPGSATEYEAWTSRGSGVTTSVTNTVAGPTSGIQATATAGGTAIEWYTKPLAAFTLGGPVLVHLRAKGSAASIGLLRCEIAVCNGDGTSPTVWGTAQSGTNGATYATYSTSEASADFWVAGDDTSVSGGKRLRIRFYLDDAAASMPNSNSATLYYAGSEGGSGDTYLKFSNTLTEWTGDPVNGSFTADAYVTKTIYGTQWSTYIADTFTRSDTGSNGGWGNAETGGTWQSTGGANITPEVLSNKGRMVLPSNGDQSAQHITTGVPADVEITAKVAYTLPNSDSGRMVTAGVSCRGGQVHTEILIHSDGTANYTVSSPGGGNYSSPTNPFTGLGLTGTFRVRMKSIGTKIYVAWWLDGQSEPAPINVTTTYTTAGYVGFIGWNDSSPDSNSHILDWDDILVTDQRLPVTTFTADAQIAESSGTTYSGSFTADAHIASTVSGTFTANANVSKSDIPGSFTADAYVRKNDISGSFTADANIKNTIAGSFTADSFVQNTISGSFAADAYVQKTLSGSFTADAYISKTTSGSVTADAFISKTTSGSFSADAHIKKTIPGTFTADAYIKRTFVYGVGGGGTVASENFEGSGGTGLAGTTAETGGDWSNVTGTLAYITLSGSGTANYLGSVNTSGRARLNSVVLGNGDAVWLNGGGTGSYAGVILRYKTDSDTGYGWEGHNDNEGNGDWNLFRLNSGSATNIGSGYIYNSGVDVSLPYWIRMRVEGSSPTLIKVKVWQDGSSEPGSWNVVDTSDNTAGNQVTSAAVGITISRESYFGSGNIAQFDVTADGGSVDGTGPTVDAYIQKTTSGSVTANAFVKNTLSGSFSADSNIASTVSGTFTADAYIQNTVAGSFTADAYLSSGTTYSGSFTADAHISKTSEQSFTADAYVKNTIASSLTADAYVQATSSGSFSADAFIQKTTAGSFTTDAFLKNTISGSFTADAVVSKTVPGSFSADAHVKNTISSSFTADATVSKTYPGSFSADAYVQATIPGSLTANAYVQNTLSGSFSADAYVQSAIGGTFTADAYISKTTSSSFTADAEIVLPDATTYPGSFTADANIKATVSGSVSSDAYIKSTIEGSVTADAYVQNTLSGELTADAHIKKTVAGSFTSDAMVQRTFEGSFSADAIVLKVNPGSFSADSYVQATTSGSFSADAYIQNTIGGSLTADAYVLRTQAGSFSVDAHVQKETSQTFSVDAYISKVGKIVWTTPGNTDAITSTPTFAFRIPPATGNMHFHIELDTVDTFDGASYRSHKSHFDQTGWEYYNGSSWVPITAAGVSNTYAGNEARYTVQTALPNATWYRRVRGGV